MDAEKGFQFTNGLSSILKKHLVKGIMMLCKKCKRGYY